VQLKTLLISSHAKNWAYVCLWVGFFSLSHLYSKRSDEIPYGLRAAYSTNVKSPCQITLGQLVVKLVSS
jgi:hypothetical protein